MTFDPNDMVIPEFHMDLVRMVNPDAAAILFPMVRPGAEIKVLGRDTYPRASIGQEAGVMWVAPTVDGGSVVITLAPNPWGADRVEVGAAKSPHDLTKCTPEPSCEVGDHRDNCEVWQYGNEGEIEDCYECDFEHNCAQCDWGYPACAAHGVRAHGSVPITYFSQRRNIAWPRQIN